MVGDGRRDLGLVADQCPPLSRIRGAVAYHEHILRKATALAYQHELATRLRGYTHDSNLEVIELRTGQSSIREWLYLTEPFPTCRMQVATLEENSGIIGIPRRS